MDFKILGPLEVRAGQREVACKSTKQRLLLSVLLIGRERELATLLPFVDDALTVGGGLVLIGGEPGIGKSRLAETLIARAVERDARILVGRCWEAGGAPAYWPWV